MATSTFYGPVGPQSSGVLSVSTSPCSSASSGDSPMTANTTLTFTVSYMPDKSLTPRDHDVIPKIEEVDEESPIDTKIESPPEGGRTNREDGEVDTAQTPNGGRRPRGRPRKHPKTPPTNLSKVPKGRSKTGCMTCRRRKKKCDETKPSCLHCQKNNVVCEGYPPKDFWQGGKQRTTKDRRVSLSRPPRDLPVIVPGLENDVDWKFFDHFSIHLSQVLSLFTDRNNPFRELLLPMAFSHIGLMHSVLCLSGSHLIRKTETDTPNDRYEDRQAYHFDRAITCLRTTTSSPPAVAEGGAVVIDDPSVAQVIVLLLRSITAGETNGEYRYHLNMAKHLVQTQPPLNPEFRAFLYEFCIYHEVSNQVTSLDRTSILTDPEFNMSDEVVSPNAAMFLGVADGLSKQYLDTVRLRDRVRARRNNGMQPVVDFSIMRDVQKIDHDLRNWESHQPEGSHKRILAYLYRQSAWLYLHRTIMPFGPTPQTHEAVEEGLHFLRALPRDSSSMSILLWPLFLLGVSTYAEEQRPDILKAFDDLQGYSNLGNIQHARRVVERIWEMMDAGDEGAWDFEKVQKEMGMDFLIT